MNYFEESFVNELEKMGGLGLWLSPTGEARSGIAGGEAYLKHRKKVSLPKAVWRANIAAFLEELKQLKE